MPIIEIQVEELGVLILILYEYKYVKMMIEIRAVTKPELCSASLLELNNDLIE